MLFGDAATMRVESRAGQSAVTLDVPSEHIAAGNRSA